MPKLQEDAKKALDDLLKQSGDEKSSVSAEVNQECVQAEAEVELGKGWTAAAWARYYWDKTWAAAGKVTKTWTKR